MVRLNREYNKYDGLQKKSQDTGENILRIWKKLIEGEEKT